MMTIVERSLFVIGLTCLGWYGLAIADAAYAEHEARVAVERALVAEAPVAPAAPDARTAPAAPNAPVAPVAPGIVGLLEIPRLGLSTPVVEGDDARALKGAAGHLRDTPHPWEDGNTAIAAHRDGLFRPLRHIRIGDEIRVRTPHGEMVYEVRDTHIVRPTDVSVLQQSKRQMLTLITCYPFYYVGAAPKRFIVHADRLDAASR